MSSDEHRLKSLFVRGLDGDEVAYREFLSGLSALLCGYVRHQLARLNRADVDYEDVVQEALIAIHTRRHTYDRTVPLTAWAHAIARYKLIDVLRAAAHPGQHLSLDEIGEIAVDDGARMQAVFDMRKLVATLPVRLRISLQSTKIEGYSVAETAAKTGMSKPSVKVNVYRALRILGRMLKGY